MRMFQIYMIKLIRVGFSERMWIASYLPLRVGCTLIFKDSMVHKGRHSGELLSAYHMENYRQLWFI